MLLPPLPPYTNNLRRFGFDDTDFAGHGSDRLVDALVAWGDIDAIAKRVSDHRRAGADHVCVQVLQHDPRGLPMQQWRALAAKLRHDSSAQASRQPDGGCRY
jgi:hypothetical protein